MARTVLSVPAQEILNKLSSEEIETLIGCSTFEQFQDMLTTYLSGECSCRFCKIDRIKNKVLYEKYSWVAWEVSSRYTTRQSSLSHQIVFFPMRHVRNHWELTKKERLGFFQVLDWVHLHFDCPGGAIVSRFGDMRWNVGTIMHLHATVMVPNRQGRVIVPLQKSVRMHRSHKVRMLGFLEKYVTQY